MLPMMIVMPLMQMIVLAYAATFEMKQIDLVVVDKDLSSSSRRLINKFEGSTFFQINKTTFSIEEANRDLKSDRVDAIIHIPAGFEKNLYREQTSKMQILINAINASTAGLISAYSGYVIADFNQNIVADNINYITLKPIKRININYSYWYNPELNSKIFMVPGILVILITMIGMFLSSLNIVREKEMGTIEQLNVTPIVKYQFIFGKLFPIWVIALVELAFGLVLAKLLFDLPFVGSLYLLFGFSAVYLIVVLGFGLLISTLASTQQQVMFIIFFFMLTFILMSGIFTPVESMPKWATYLNVINPFAYFMRVIRMVMLKGSAFSDILKEFYSLLIYGIALLSLAVLRYRKTT
jgi:ABC-2 type transport system permease protein